MAQRIEYTDRNSVIDCFLPESSAPDKNAAAELHRMTGLEETLERLADRGFFQGEGQRIEKIVLTPGFHKGSGIPIGTVMMTKGFAVPQAMGRDINCGMRFYTTDLPEEKLQERLLKRTVFRGSLRADDMEGLEDFVGSFEQLTYDDQIGTIGGGNHFLEVQRVAEIYDGQTANAWNIKKRTAAVMLHGGSLTIGHHSGLLNCKICQEIYPAGLAHPENGIYPIPEAGVAEDAWNRFWSVTANAANFAFANRLFLGFMIQDALTDVLGEFEMELLYDAPHNYIWHTRIDGVRYYIHRKGACPAGGFEEMEGTEFACYGEPVMIPGSMGSSGYLLRGLGNPESLWSASHGAGRKQSRGDAIRGNDEEFRRFMEKFHIITPIDPGRNDLRGRNDILKNGRNLSGRRRPMPIRILMK